MLDDGAGGKVDVNAVSATTTMTSLTSGGGRVAVLPRRHRCRITGAITALGNQSLGFAGRIAVNAALLADPSKLVVYQTAPLRRPATRRGRISSSTG